MEPTPLDEQYWTSRYEAGETGWDIGHASPALTNYFDQLPDKTIDILIPGAGNAYEAHYLVAAGFTGVTVCDIARPPLAQFEGQSVIKTIHGDFFQLHGAYDLIIEQTFFCALDPVLRPAYVEKMHQLLKPGGKLVGLLFSSVFEKQGPPFGGTAQEYQILFGEKIHIKRFSNAYNSIMPRKDNELFVIFQKK
ncbi:MAG: SAM-dependent methyltransferase [Saprospiraceae bacterium]|nr:SAM-dependent methyltransferase [Saprospiraceae bacterium]